MKTRMIKIDGNRPEGMTEEQYRLYEEITEVMARHNVHTSIVMVAHEKDTDYLSSCFGATGCQHCASALAKNYLAEVARMASMPGLPTEHIN